MNNQLEQNYKKIVRDRDNQRFIYREEYFFPLLPGNNRDLKQERISGKLDEEKYNRLLKNYKYN
jgi:hypothetical protein